ncbi:MAG: hypothetical protein AB9922_12270 [Bacteroidales bacterium]
MIIVTKDDKQYIPLLIGKIESTEIGEFITCIEARENPVLNIFQQVDHVRIHISEIRGFRGSYSFPPIVLGQKKATTKENWETHNPILPYGTYGVESDTGEHKIGDGVLRWNALPYANK